MFKSKLLKSTFHAYAATCSELDFMETAVCPGY